MVIRQLSTLPKSFSSLLCTKCCHEDSIADQACLGLGQNMALPSREKCARQGFLVVYGQVSLEATSGAVRKSRGRKCACRRACSGIRPVAVPSKRKLYIETRLIYRSTSAYSGIFCQIVSCGGMSGVHHCDECRFYKRRHRAQELFLEIVI